MSGWRPWNAATARGISVAPALWNRGVGRIDAVFLSHADHDHYDGLPDLLDRFSIVEVRLPPGFAGVNNPLAVELVEQLQKRSIPVRPITAPARWQQAGVQFSVWHPPDGWRPETSDNARSLVLDVAFAGRRDAAPQFWRRWRRHKSVGWPHRRRRDALRYHLGWRRFGEGNGLLVKAIKNGYTPSRS